MVEEGGYDYTGTVVRSYRNGSWYVRDDQHGCTCVHMAGSLHPTGLHSAWGIAKPAQIITEERA